MSIAESVLRFAEVSVPDQKHNLEDIKKIVDLFNLSELVEFVRELNAGDDIQHDEYTDKVVDFMSSTLPANHPFSVLDYHYINMLLVIIGYAIKEEESESDDPKPEAVEEQTE